jgi:Fe-Mn family superoxide dismutase
MTERGFEGSVKSIALQTARDPAEAAVFNHASMAFNNHFFFESIAEYPEQQMNINLQAALTNDFGSIDNLKTEMLAMANAMFGPGFVWLVRINKKDYSSEKEFKLLTTYLAGSPFAGAHNRRQPVDMNTQNVAAAQAAGSMQGLSQQHMTVQNTAGVVGQYAQKTGRELLAYGGADVMPTLCVSTWEHTYYHDWKYNKNLFVERWWNFIDWDKVYERSGIEDELRKKRESGGNSYHRGLRYQ